MAVDWRALFADLGIFWVDHGRNCGRDHINIQCPWCDLLDPSQHLTIHEFKGVYYCYRDPRHKGGEPLYLIQKLVRSRARAAALLNAYYIETGTSTPAPIEATPYDDFLPAQQSADVLDYLAARVFERPEWVCRFFNLRVSLKGTWAGRVLLPLRACRTPPPAGVQAWTGRALSPWLQPRYRQSEVPAGSSWIGGIASGETLVVVEGPFDALKINAACAQHLAQISAISLNGLKLSQGASRLVAELQPRRILIALDEGVSLATVASVRYNLQHSCPRAVIGRQSVPDRQKDPAAMSEQAIRTWLAV